MRRIKHWLIVIALLGLLPKAGSFSLLGPYPQWQLDSYDGFNIGYNLEFDIGGPHNLGEGYRWNIPVITYAYDASFINYFGSNGIAAVDGAIEVLNDLPVYALITNDASSLYVNGERVPTDTRRINFFAQSMGLFDLKSRALGTLVEELGLAEPDRFSWTLAGRQLAANNTVTNWTVVHRNFDPITFLPTPYVNNARYTYSIVEVGMPNRADAIETAVDPLSFPFSAVAGTSGSGGLGFTPGIAAGVFFTGLTHDDLGGLRYLYRTNAIYTESLIGNIFAGSPSTAAGSGNSPWAGFFSFTNLFVNSSNFLFLTNIVNATNATNFIVTGLRPGIGKVVFQKVQFDSLLGQTFETVTNQYTDTVITNGQVVVQPLLRAINTPDLIFSAGRLGLFRNLTPVFLRRTVATGWVNNDAINGADPEIDGGPGVIDPPIQITFTDQLPYFSNTTPFFLDEATGFSSVVWGSFDGTTNAPIVFPQSSDVNLQFIRSQLGL